MINMTDSKNGKDSAAKLTASRQNLSNHESSGSLEFNNIFNSG